MEVILKKSKITNSILGQTLIASMGNFKTMKVLGWCYYKTNNWIVLYNEETNELRRYPLFKSIERMPISYGRVKDEIKVYNHNMNTQYYTFDTEEEAITFYDLINGVKSTAMQLGQFFL